MLGPCSEGVSLVQINVENSDLEILERSWTVHGDVMEKRRSEAHYRILDLRQEIPQEPRSVFASPPSRVAQATSTTTFVGLLMASNTAERFWD